VRVDILFTVSKLRLLLATLLVAVLLASAPVVGASDLARPMADDPELEARVMALARDLRCLVCQNESIAESRAPLAVDLRAQVREQLGAGKSETEVLDFLVSRYGDFVLYKPPFRASTALLWLGPVLLLFGGLGWLQFRLRRRAEEPAQKLSDEERRRARALLEGAPSDSEEQQP
jgi:cytochrome c-type biogenesis protein CcmH